MKILFVTAYYRPAYVYGGPVRSTANLCAALTQLGADVTVLTTNANGNSPLRLPLGKPLDIEGVSVYYYPLTFGGVGGFYSRSAIKALKTKVVQNDLVVSQTLWGYISEPLRHSCKDNKIPYVIQLHGQLQPWALAKKSAKKRIFLAFRGRKFLDQAAALHCTDDEEAAEVQKLGFKTPTFVVSNGIETRRHRYHQICENYRLYLGIPDQAIVLLFLGRLTPIKRPDIVVQVCAALHQKNFPVHAIFAGPDEAGQEDKLRSLAANSGVSNQVHFTGLLSGEQVRDVLAISNLLIMPSEVHENFGMSALEAMASGVPILVSNGIPVGNWAVHSHSGRMVPCEPTAFIEAAYEMLLDPSNLQRIGKKGQEFVCQKFDTQIVARQMLAQIEAIIKTGKPISGQSSDPSNDVYQELSL